MKKISKILLATLVAAGSGFCREDWHYGIHELEPMYYDDEHPEGYYPDFYSGDLPVGATAKRHLIVDDNGGSYLPIPNCSDITDASGTRLKDGIFTVTGLTESYKKYKKKSIGI